jgi:beta-1,4-N-acetylglucosaminyltransferase
MNINNDSSGVDMQKDSSEHAPLHNTTLSLSLSKHPQSDDGKTLFVTVGTTLFQDLMDAVTSPPALEWLLAHNYCRWILQYGTGTKPIIPLQYLQNEQVHVEMYAFKPSLRDDMEQADLIVSHAGAGTVQELLQLISANASRKVAVAVVINRRLMHNHQCELAHALGGRQHLYVVESPSDLYTSSTWDALQAFVPVPSPGGDEYEFAHVLNDCMGIPASAAPPLPATGSLRGSKT